MKLILTGSLWTFIGIVVNPVYYLLSRTLSPLGLVASALLITGGIWELLIGVKKYKVNKILKESN